MGGIEIGNIMFGYTYDIGIQILKPTTMGRTKFLGMKLNRGDNANTMEKEK